MKPIFPRIVACMAALVVMAASGTAAATTAVGADQLEQDTQSPATEPAADATMDGNIWITGTLRVGGTVLAKAGATWPSGTRFTYQWAADGHDIPGATDFAYTPTLDDFRRELSVTVTATREGYEPVTKTATALDVGEGVFVTEKPYIGGTPAPWKVVHAKVPPWTPEATEFEYDWIVDGIHVGDGSPSLEIRSAWAGKVLKVHVTASRPAYPTVVVTSNSVRIGRAFSTSPVPEISGPRNVGRTLKAIVGNWSPTPSSLSYQWYADGRAIPDATGKWLTLKGPQYRKEITVAVTAKRTGYAGTTRVSEATTEIGRPGVAFSDGKWSAGPDGDVPRGTYIARVGATAPTCHWLTLDSDVVWSGTDTGVRQRVLTVGWRADHTVQSDRCGDWRRHYPGMVVPQRTTADDGVYVLGDHLERGRYVTTGGTDPHRRCEYVVLTEATFYYHDHGGDLILEGSTNGPKTIMIPDGAGAFRTEGCSWTRVG